MDNIQQEGLHHCNLRLQQMSIISDWLQTDCQDLSMTLKIRANDLAPVQVRRSVGLSLRLGWLVVPYLTMAASLLVIFTVDTDTSSMETLVDHCDGSE